MPPLAKSRESRAGSWEQTFPVELKTELNSAQFAYRFIKLASSFILDKRRIFEDTDKIFINRTIDGLIIPAFEKKNPIGKRLGDKLASLKDAIDQRYLREFAIVFYKTPDEEDIIEVYSFRLLYSKDGDIALTLNTGFGSEEDSSSLLSAKFTNLEDTKQQFVKTFKKLHKSMKILEDFPADADASFRVSFTDETPKDYTPDGFVGHAKFYEFDEVAMSIGVVCGGHHKIQVLASSKLIKENRRFTDLNATCSSINNMTILAASPAPTKRVASKVVGKVHKRKPYGQSQSIEPVDSQS